jgi:hypothetical protein
MMNCEDRIINYHHGDATLYQHPKSIDIIVTETLYEYTDDSFFFEK